MSRVDEVAETFPMAKFYGVDIGRHDLLDVFDPP